MVVEQGGQNDCTAALIVSEEHARKMRK